MWKNYIKIAFRNLLKSKLFTAINITGLSIGMAAALLIFVWVQNELSFDDYHKDSDRIYRVMSNIKWGDDRMIWSGVQLPLTEAATEIPEIEMIGKVRHIFSNPVLRTSTGKLFTEKNLAYVDENWFDLFKYEVIEGDLTTFSNNLYSIALTESKAVQFFGYKAAVGQTLYIDSIAYAVDLILKDNPTNSVLSFDGFIPLNARYADKDNLKNDQSWGNYDCLAFIKTKPQVNPKIVEEKLLAILDKNKRTEKAENTSFASLELLQDIRFSQAVTRDKFQHQNKSTVYIFALIGLLLLISASFNYVNLSTALINKRVKEIGVKKIVGASFGHIFWQVMIETLLLSSIAMVFALGLAQYGLPFLQEITGIALQIDISSYHIWYLLGGLIGLNVLVAGIYPATLFAGFKPIQLVRGKLLNQQGITLRKGLVVSQFIIAIIMLMSTVVAFQQLQFIQQKNVGYDRSYVLEISPQLFNGNYSENLKNFARFKQGLEGIAEFEAVAITNNSLVNIRSGNAGNFKWKGKAEDNRAAVSVLTADEDLLSVFDLTISDGRWFDKKITNDKNNYLINETAAQKLNIPEPIVGAAVNFKNQEGRIIGVVKDFHYRSLHKKIAPLLITYNGQNYSTGTILARVNGKTGTMALQKAAKEFAIHLPHIPFAYTFLDDSFEKMHESEAKMTLLFQIFACLLIFISCLGLFGLATFAIERRTKEIGIRKILGANTRLIVQLLSKDFLKLVLIALLIAIPIAWTMMQNWLENYAYRIEVNWWILAIVGGLIIGLAFLTVSIQSIRAALENPVKALKTE